MANLVVSKQGDEWLVIDADNFMQVAVFSTEQAANQFAAEGDASALAVLSAEEQNIVSEGGLISEPPGVPSDGQTQADSEGLIRLNDGANLGVPDEEGFVQTSTGLNVLPEDQEPGEPDGYLTEFTPTGSRVLNPQEVSRAQEQATAESAARDRARQQQTLKEQRKQSNNGDWRLKISLAPQANYLYKLPAGQAGGAGILWPLKETNGVIFPYTPTVQMNYRANYSQYDLTHSNYRGYFYNNSYVDAITITGTFTAQSTFEADYLLAVIHFFRSVTKMFYGQDVERGSPPPLVYLTGMGEYQFNRHACVVQNFSYTLPPDVDYIRARSVGQAGLNLTTRRDKQSQAPVDTGFSVLNRLQTAFLSKGAEKRTPSPPSLGVDSATYVPTKMDIQLSLLPMQSRSEVSQQFSLKQFANGDLLKGGFW